MEKQTGILMMEMKMVPMVKILRVKMVTVMEILRMQMVTAMEMGVKEETKKINGYGSIANDIIASLQANRC